MERDSAVFYRSFYEAAKELPGEVQTDIYKAMFEYAFYKNEIELQGTAKAIFTLIKPQLDANIRKFENGKNGGRPAKSENQSETKSEPKDNQEETKAKGNENVSVSDNASLNSNSNADVDADEKITITAGGDLFFKNEKVFNAFLKDHSINVNQLKELQKKYHLHLEKKQIETKTLQDYINHFDSCIKKGFLESSNSGFISTDTKRWDNKDLGKMPRSNNTSDNIPTFTIDEFKISLENAVSSEYVESFYKAYGFKDKNLGFIVDKFILYIKTQGLDNQPKSIKDAASYFSHWCRQEFEKGNLNSHLKYPKKQAGAL